MLRIANCEAIRWFWSTSTLATLTLPRYCFATSSTTGDTMRQGPHHSAQKSTSTGTCDLSTSASNVLSLTWITASAMSENSLHDEGTTGSRHMPHELLETNDLDSRHQGSIRPAVDTPGGSA